MTDVTAIIEASMRADADSLRVIGQNIANADVIAYRRQVPVSAVQFDQVMASLAPETPIAASTELRTAIDHRPGTIKATGQALDVAIEGRGFFVVQSSNETVFTRRGDLRVSADGMLTTVSGALVLGDNGPIHVGTSAPTIDAEGVMRIGEDVVDQLRLTHFADEAQLTYLGDGLYAAANEAVVDGGGYSILRQGFLETSNVTPVGEMIQMMEAMRRFESAQRLARGYDQMMEKAISELGKVG